MVSKTGTNRALNKKKAGDVASSRTAVGTRQTAPFIIYPSLGSKKSLFFSVTLFRKEERKPAGLTELLRPASNVPTRSAGSHLLPFCAFGFNLLQRSSPLFGFERVALSTLTESCVAFLVSPLSLSLSHSVSQLTQLSILN
jgi:hypothetical protein